jgi:hypothetical protein
VSEGLDLIKGGGGALTREKIVNFAARTNVIIVDESKLSRKLGEKWAVPVEVVRFGHASTAKALARFGSPALRTKDGKAAPRFALVAKDGVITYLPMQPVCVKLNKKSLRLELWTCTSHLLKNLSTLLKATILRLLRKSLALAITTLPKQWAIRWSSCKRLLVKLNVMLLTFLNVSQLVAVL